MMRDPHVEALYYEIGTGEGISFGTPPPLSVVNRLGTFELADGKLTIRPADHYPSGNEARAVLEPFLHAWEVDLDLTRNIGSIRFKFLRNHKVDRDPHDRSAGVVSVAAEAADVVVASDAASVHITQGTYPIPPADFRTTPEVDLAYLRWRSCREGREPLQSMAYAVLTLLQSVAGGRKEAVKTFNVNARILDTIARLSSTKGDATTLRKFGAGFALQALSGPESSWLEAAVRRLVRRMGEHAAGIPLSELTMSDLPRL
jgi:hypothetical protein